MTMDRARLFAKIDEIGGRIRGKLVDLSLGIHAQPELAFKEYEAAKLLSNYLAGEGFDVTLGAAGMETAFIAEWRGGDGPTVAFLAEYDALPDVGHACGHNIIGTSAAAAGVLLKRAWPEMPGRILVLGTPAEEGGGGKIVMVDAGVFDDVDVALMMHPTTGESKVGGTSLATSDLVVNFRGRPAHAAGSPHRGINALDAVVQTYVNVSMLRQHVTPDVRMHCLITKGGSVINVVPEEAEIKYLLRAATREGVDNVVKRVRDCAEGAAASTMAEVSFVETKGYDERWPNTVLGNLMREHFARVGVDMPPEPSPSGGSTDFGNVSKAVPAANAYVSIGPNSVASHSREFAACAASEEGHLALLQSAQAMATMAYDLLTQPDLVARAKEEHRERAAAVE